jgi:hypothetical protein
MREMRSIHAFDIYLKSPILAMRAVLGPRRIAGMAGAWNSGMKWGMVVSMSTRRGFWTEAVAS